MGLLACDSHVNTPLCRKLLLNSVLLCAASEAGDDAEVSRLLSQCCVPANVCGLRHKAPLHLAASQGHIAVLNTLIAAGVSLIVKSTRIFLVCIWRV